MKHCRVSDSGSALIDLAEARVTLVAALAWRAIAEIARRRSTKLKPRLVQFHPGSSSRGVISLRLYEKGQGACSAEVDFNLGGPSGTYNCAGGLSDVEGKSFAGLLYKNPKATIDEIERNMGLLAFSGRLPESTTRVIAIRLISGLLERRLFDPKPWRASLAVWDWNGGYGLNDWHECLLGKKYSFDQDGSLPAEIHTRLSDLVLIHAADAEEGSEVLEVVPSDSLAIDLDSGLVSIVRENQSRPFGECRALFEAHNRSISDLVSTLDKVCI
jgi:hypothetical protein